MKTRRIGDREVGRIGLGCMGMSWAYGEPDNDESLRVLARALELGMNHWDTADLYGAGANETLLAQALKGNRDRVYLATKFGNVFDRTLTSHQDQVAANANWIVDGTPAYLRRACELSLQRLQVDTIDLYYAHRVDPRVPIEETVGEMTRLKEEGKIRQLGLSEASAESIRRAHATHPIAALQTEYSLWTRDVEDEILPTCRELGIAFVPYSPLGRGFLTGRFASFDDLPENDYRRTNPRWQGENFDRNMAIVDTVRGIAERKEATPAQVALAWVLAQGEDILPIPGTKQVRYLEQNSAADALELSAEDLRTLADLPQAVGTRYAEHLMEFVNR